MSTESTPPTPSENGTFAGREHLDETRLSFWADIDVHDQTLVDEFIAALESDRGIGAAEGTPVVWQSDRAHLLTCDFCANRQSLAGESFARALRSSPSISGLTADPQTRGAAIAKAMEVFDRENAVAVVSRPSTAAKRRSWQLRRGTSGRGSGAGSISGGTSGGFAIKPSFVLGVAAALTAVTGIFLVQQRRASNSADAPLLTEAAASAEASAPDLAATETEAATATEAAATEAAAAETAGPEAAAVESESFAEEKEASAVTEAPAAGVAQANDASSAAGTQGRTTEAAESVLDMAAPPSLVTSAPPSRVTTSSLVTSSPPTVTTAAPVTVKRAISTTAAPTTLVSPAPEAAASPAATNTQKKSPKKPTKSAQKSKTAPAVTTAADPAAASSSSGFDLGDLGEYADLVAANQAIVSAGQSVGLGIGTTTVPTTLPPTTLPPTTVASAVDPLAPATTASPASPATTSAPAVAAPVQAAPAAAVEATPVFDDSGSPTKPTIPCATARLGARATGRIVIAGRPLLVVIPAAVSGATMTLPIFVDPVTCAPVVTP